MILSDAGQAGTLDRLWADLNMITDAPLRQFQSMIWFERTDSHYMTNPDFSFVRPEDGDLGEDPKFSQFRDRVSWRTSTPAGHAPGATRRSWNTLITWRSFSKTPPQAGRRPSPNSLIRWCSTGGSAGVSPAAVRVRQRKQDLLAYYHTLRKDNALDHEEAVRDVLVSILMSPYFCYHYVTSHRRRTRQCRWAIMSWPDRLLVLSVVEHARCGTTGACRQW